MMVRNTEERSWHGFWHLPQDKDKHPGILTYDPANGFLLELLSEGFESPFVECDDPTQIFQPPSKGGVYKLRDHTNPYNAIHGEVEGKLVTLLDVFFEGSTRNLGAPTTHGRSTYHPSIMLIGTHLADKAQTAFTSINVSLDYLHIWVQNTDWLEVGVIHPDHDKKEVEPQQHYIRATLPQAFGPKMGTVINEDTALTLEYDGTLPSLKWSAYEFEASSRIYPSVKLTCTNGERSLESFLPIIHSIHTLVSICMDRSCRPHAYRGTVRFEKGTKDVEIIVPRQGSCPDEEANGKSIVSLATCSKEKPFINYFEGWFPLLKKAPCLALLNGFLDNSVVPVLETNILMAHTLVESYHKALYGKGINSILDETKNIARNRRENRENQITAFKRAVDLVQRLPKEMRRLLVPSEERWASTLVDARNSISHEGKLKEVDPLEAAAATRVAVALITIHVLIQLRVSESSTLLAFNNHSSISRARKLAKDYLNPSKDRNKGSRS